MALSNREVLHILRAIRENPERSAEQIYEEASRRFSRVIPPRDLQEIEFLISDPIVQGIIDLDKGVMEWIENNY